jgi:hypothetical protein
MPWDRELDHTGSLLAYRAPTVMDTIILQLPATMKRIQRRRRHAIRTVMSAVNRGGYIR